MAAAGVALAPAGARARLGWRIAAIVVGALVCIAVPAYQLLVDGPFAWHVRTPEYLDGGAEALLLIALLLVAAWRNGRIALFACAIVPSVLYLRHNAVDASLLLDLAYVEVVIGLGLLARRALGSSGPSTPFDYATAFALGLVVWSLCAWTVSALGFGSFKALRWLTLLLAVPTLAARATPFCAMVARRFRAEARGARLLIAAIVGWILVLYARSHVVYGADSVWYGLRGEFVLSYDGSAFRGLGLVSPVYYFPKLYEVFLLPVSGLGDSSAIVGVSILTFALTLVAFERIARRLGTPPVLALALTLAIATLPVLANAALETKPDVVAALFVLLAAEAAFDVVDARDRWAFARVVGYGAIAVSCKLTAIPFCAALGLALALAIARRRVGAATDVPPGARRESLAFAAGALVVAAFVVARTWRLAGVPTIGPDALLATWRALGLELAPPAGTLNWTQPAAHGEVAAIAFDWLFRPQRLEHGVIMWTGNVWLWLVLVALVVGSGRAGGRTLAPRAWPLVATVLCGVALALGIRYQVRGGDGNYFLAGVLAACALAGSGAAFAIDAHRVLARTLVACLALFAGFHAAYAFASAAWTPGTRAFDANFCEDWRGFERWRRTELAKAGVAGIADYLRALRGRPRAIGWVEEPAGTLLPLRYEHVRTMRYSRPEYVDDAEHLLAFAHAQSIDYAIVARPPPDWAYEIGQPVLDDARYVLFAINGPRERP